MPKPAILLSLWLLVSVLSGCGQTGDLYLPSEPPTPEQADQEQDQDETAE